MHPPSTATESLRSSAHAVLMVDDEAHACKWFARLYGDEFVIWTAGSVDQALSMLDQRGAEVAVVLTDYHMPGGDGVSLLKKLHQTRPHIARLLASAYADKAIALAAVNEGQVEGILEKPLDEALTRRTLRDALARSLERERAQTLQERRTSSLRETLGFLAHEVTTPLTTVSGYLSAMKDRHGQILQTEPDCVRLAERRPGEFLHMVEAAQRRTAYAQSLVSTFVHSARDAELGASGASLSASDLVQEVLRSYPLDPQETGWLGCDVVADFVVPGRRDLLYLVLCTLVKNALIALRSAPPTRPRVELRLALAQPVPGAATAPAILVMDNGPGIADAVLARLTHEPVTTRAEAGGSGMGLLLSQRVMASLGGSVSVVSEPGAGTCVTLHFPSTDLEINSP